MPYMYITSINRASLYNEIINVMNFYYFMDSKRKRGLEKSPVSAVRLWFDFALRHNPIRGSLVSTSHVESPPPPPPGSTIVIN